MRRLLYQLFLINLAIFLVTVFAVFATNWWITPKSSPLGRAQLAVSMVVDVEQPPEILDARLANMQREFDGRSSIYDRDARLIASNITPPLPLETEFGTSKYPTYDSAGAETGWIVFGPLPGKVVNEAGRALLQALAIAGVLGLGLAFIMTRRLVEPITRLTEATRAVGRGEFGGQVALQQRDEVGELGQAFDQMTRRLALLQRSQRELLASVSHELRTPLSRLRFVQTMLQEGESVDELLPELGADLDELERMVAGVLAAARVDLDLSHQAALTLGPRELVDARALVDRIAARFRLAHADRELLVEAADPLGAIEADVPTLLRACDNLLDNAYRHGPPDRALQLQASRVDGQLVLAFIDEGPGIAEELHELLFTPFFRADPSRSRETGGLGLGLTIVARIIEAHGGTVDVESSVGAGATFRIRLPSE